MMAQELPICTEVSKVRVSGTELAANGHSGVDTTGFYLCEKERVVNHERRMKESFKRGGLKALEGYCKTVIANYQSAHDGQVEIGMGVIERKDTFIPIGL